MLLDEIKVLNENNQIEFKKAKGGLPNSLWTSYSAFANTNGGTIVLGIYEPQKNVYVSAMLSEAEVNDLHKKFWDTINNTLKVSINILVDKDVYIDTYEDYYVLVIKVKRANRYDKPVYINGNVYNGTFRRNNEGDYHCNKPEIDLMIKDASNVPTDKTCLEDFTLDDLNQESILAYKQMLKATSPNHIFLTMSDENFYLNLGVAKKNNDGQIRLTRAGLLMFGKEYRITDEFSNYYLDYQDHREETPELRWIDRVQSFSGDWSGNVFDFFFKVYNKLIQDIFIPFKMEGVQRIDDTIMHKALREALCNTLTNADYYGQRGVVIKKFKDKIEFSNPGVLRMSIDEILEGGNSDPRNPTILKIFSLIKIGERAGTGFQTILYAIKTLKYQIPMIVEKYNPDRTKITLFLTNKLNLKQNILNESTIMDELLQDEIKIIELIKNKEKITRKDIEEKFSFGKTKSSILLKKLVEKQIIQVKGNGKNTYYIINDYVNI